MDRSEQVVVLVHGWCAHRWLLEPTARALRLAGYETVRWGYPSCTKSIQYHGDRLAALLKNLVDAKASDRVHVVAHSMGGLVLRAAAHAGDLQLARVVMLCTPNHGSFMATRMKNLLGWISPTLLEICDDRNSPVHTLPSDLCHRAQVGVVVTQHDWVVRQQSMLLEGAVDTAYLNTTHAGVLFSRTSHRLIKSFLLHGKFSPGS
ncbi:MAG: alpha/beta fold hydrolase [Planctomycetales bacterium]|nr:alpha/beta fold hydrolase [Planctomycetales bacterium]